MRVALADLTALTVLSTVFLPLPSQTQQPTFASYERLLARMKHGSADVDFQALRDAYAADASYACKSASN